MYVKKNKELSIIIHLIGLKNMSYIHAFQANAYMWKYSIYHLF